VSVHLSTDELSDALTEGPNAQDTTPGESRVGIEKHLRDCSQCAQTWRALVEVRTRLAAEPTPSMPADVAHRLDAALAAETRQRARVGRRPPSPYQGKPTLGPFGADLPRRSRPTLVLSGLAAGAVAAMVGVAASLLSASSRLNEPPAVAPALVSSSQLGTQAEALRRAADLSAHRFSPSWRCARQVTTGKITALTAAVVDGRPALLVYTEADETQSSVKQGPDTTSTHTQRVTVVTGCGDNRPVAGAATVLPR